VSLEPESRQVFQGLGSNQNAWVNNGGVSMKNRILKHFVWWIPAVSGLIACQTQDSLSPSGLEGQIGGRILVEGGTPAGGARVDVFRCGDTTMFPVARAFSGTDGVYQVDGLEGGCYSVLMDDGAGNVAFSTSLRLDQEAPKASLDGKLRPWGYVAGKISVQPWDSPRCQWTLQSDSVADT
jgi:hypothetical protein